MRGSGRRGIWIYVSQLREIPKLLVSRWKSGKPGQQPDDTRDDNPVRRPPWWFFSFVIAAAATLAVLLRALGPDGWSMLLFHLLNRGASTLSLGFVAMVLILMRHTGSRVPPGVVRRSGRGGVHRSGRRPGDSGDVGATQADRARPKGDSMSQQPLLRLVTASLYVWLFAAVGHLLVEGLSHSGPLGLYATRDWEGRMLALQILLVVAVALTAPWTVNGPVRAAVVFALAFVAMFPLALAPLHEIGLEGGWLLGIHVIATALWTGGLAGLVTLATGAMRTNQVDDGRLLKIAREFSGLALVSVVAVAISGMALGLGWLGAGHGHVGDLVSTVPGRLVLAKLAALVLLVAAGAVHRGVTLKRLEHGDARPLVTLAIAELVIMAIAITLGVGLAPD